MKALLLSAFLLATAISALAQGFLIFQNSSTTGITNSVTGVPAYGDAVAQNDTQVGLYMGNVGDPVSSLSLVTTTNCNNPGRFSGGVRLIPGWTGLVQIQVRAWLASTVYPSYESAYAAGLGGDTSVFIGGACPQFIVLAAVGEVPRSIAPGMTSIIIVPVTADPLEPGVVCPVPEPSSVALGVLGLGALLLLRRKK